MKKAQVTLFVIVAIILVASTLTYFVLIKPSQASKKSNQPKFERCVSEVLNSNIKSLAKTSGLIAPKLTYNYKGEKIPYLCYTNEYFKTCTVQVPFIKNTFEKNLNKISEAEIKECFKNSLSELQKAGYDVASTAIKQNTTILRGKIHTTIKAPLRTGQKTSKTFVIDTPSPLYDLLMIATSIIQFEARYGDADTSSFKILYPQYHFLKLKQGDDTKIYILEDPKSKISIEFASKSLVFTEGY